MPAPGVEAVCGPEVSLDPSSSWMGMSREQKYLEMNQSEVSNILDQPITVEYNSPEDILGEGSCTRVEASCSLKAESLGHLTHHHLEMNQSEVSNILDQPITVEYNSSPPSCPACT